MGRSEQNSGVKIAQNKENTFFMDNEVKIFAFSFVRNFLLSLGLPFVDGIV